MKYYIVPRRRQTEYEQMIKIYDWCVEAFDKKSDYLRWGVNYAQGTEEFVEFSFKHDADASAFLFQWDQYCLSKPEQWAIGVRTWDDL